MNQEENLLLKIKLVFERKSLYRENFTLKTKLIESPLTGAIY